MTRELRLLRKQRKLSQQALARLAGITKGYLSKIEQGTANPTQRVLVKLAGSLGVSPTALMERAASPATSSSEWPADEDIGKKIEAAWNAISRCHPGSLRTRRKHDHMPAAWFSILMQLRTGDVVEPVGAKEVHRKVGRTRSSAYRELAEMERALLLSRRQAGRRVFIELGPAGYVWLNEELGRAEDLNPFDPETVARFWLKASTWIGGSAVVHELSKAEFAAEEKGARIECRLRSRFESALRRGSDSIESSRSARSATASVLETVPRDPGRTIEEMRATITKVLGYVDSGPMMKVFEEPQLQEARGIFDQLGIGGSLQPSVMGLIRIVLRSALYDLELIANEIHRQGT